MATRQAAKATASDAGYWWVFLISGVVWFLIGLTVLRFDERSTTTVGVIMGVVFLVAALTEFLGLWLVPSPIWRIFHGVMALLFGLAAIWAFTQPEKAFWALASVLGFVLVFAGTVDILRAVITKPFNPAWWLGLVSGILLLVLAFWVSQQLVDTKANLLLFYVGLFAALRGIGQMLFAFLVRSSKGELAEL